MWNNEPNPFHIDKMHEWVEETLSFTPKVMSSILRLGFLCAYVTHQDINRMRERERINIFRDEARDRYASRRST
jgi:hypothetical protein